MPIFPHVVWRIATAQDPSSLFDHLGTESQHNHVDRHDQSNDHKNDMKGKERDEHIVVQSFRAAETFFPFKGQHTQLPEEIVTDEKPSMATIPPSISQ